MTKPDAQTAINILTVIHKECGPAALAYWVTPNTILTLSGARAYCDGVFWSDDTATLNSWQSEIDASLAALKSAAAVLGTESGVRTVRKNERYASYDLLLVDGLRYRLQHTALLGKADTADLLQPSANHAKTSKTLHKLLLAQERFHTYDAERLSHISFGILVGYPDEAIIGAVEYWTEHENDPFAEPLIAADIRGAGYYSCPQPVYDYPRHLVTDKTIQAHEQEWSQILREYYVSDFHKALEANPQFQKKIQALGNER